MKRKGSGSQNSPIAIDDSEDEVNMAQDLKPGPITRSRLLKHQEGSYLQQPMSFHDKTFIPKDRQKDRDHQVHSGQKRKRTHIDQHDDYAASPSSGLPPSSLEVRFSNVPSKKARKRRRRLERQVMEAEARSKPHFWMNGVNGMNKFLPDQILPSFTWVPDALPYTVPDPLSPITPFVNGAQTYPNLSQDPRSKVSYTGPPFNNCQQYSTNLNNRPIASTSAWVSSMAMAAENPAPIVVDSWTPPPNPPQPAQPQWSTTPELTPTTPHSASVHPLPKKPNAMQPSVREPPEPPKPPPLPIGMKPDQDPSSKHGLFEPPVAAPTPSSGSGASHYIPNPARTLVIEQLPKSHRNAEWINSWCKSACGAHPVHLSINGQGAKALVEFATAELARKAWGSPRLGANYAGLKSHQLKGKPRDDLIKAWWYRVDGIGAGAGVGEIEEGEIEGDAAEKEVEVPAKKETKKERKVRLARERMEKQKKQADAVKTSVELRPQSRPVLSSLPQRPPPASSSTLPLRPVLPNPVQRQNVNQQVNHPSALPSYPRPALHRPQQPPSRLALPSQSELTVQWREEFNPVKRLDKTSYGASVRQQANSATDTDNESIASSRSPSPVQLSPSLHEVPPPSASGTSFDDHPDVVDVDDASVDMDLSSPVTSRHPQPPPKSHSVPSTPSFPLSSPAPRIALHSPIPSPEPDSAPPVSAPSLPSNCTSRVPSAQNHLPPSSSASMHSSTPRGTPPLEPRAMKNVPKAPSYTKRSLLARHKELEERIAKSRLELGLELPAAADSPVTPTTPSDLPSQNRDSEKKQAMEERLRMLVLRSQRSKLKADTPPTTASSSSLSTSSEAISSNSSNSSTGAATPAPTASDATTSFSLDDLAVSFITETIQTYKTSPQISKAVTTVSVLKPPSQANSNTKLELAAKQKRLEQEIMETKILMAKLTQARTKPEKDSILAEMREKSRSMGEDASNSTLPQVVNDQSTAKQPTAQTSINWPKSHRDAGVLIVSDDEDDSDSEDSGMD